MHAARKQAYTISNAVFTSNKLSGISPFFISFHLYRGIRRATILMCWRLQSTVDRMDKRIIIIVATAVVVIAGVALAAFVAGRSHQKEQDAEIVMNELRTAFPVAAARASQTMQIVDWCKQHGITTNEYGELLSKWIAAHPDSLSPVDDFWLEAKATTPVELSRRYP